MANSCKHIRDNLIECIKNSPCWLEEGNTFGECLRSNDIPQPCKALRYTFYSCKRGQLDMRKRFRGNLYEGTENTEDIVAQLKEESQSKK